MKSDAILLCHIEGFVAEEEWGMRDPREGRVVIKEE